MNNIILNNGVEVPQVGLGVFLTGEGSGTVNAVKWALDAGYRHIDTAAVYGNEAEVGIGIAASSVPRSEIFITGKVWNDDIRNGRVREAFERTLEYLGTDYLDMYLLHWPAEGTRQAWEALEDLYFEEKVRAIGVSNFQIHHLKDLMNYGHVIPALNQVESHPLMTNQELISWCRKYDIATGAWSPLGGPRVPLLEHPVLIELGEKYGKTPAHIVLRWDIQRNVIVIPKSSHKERIEANLDVFDFQLSNHDMQRIQSLDMGLRVGPDPDNFDF
ncbi:MAG: aldo/keto reductase [Eubacteriaceae bacterium]|jgi:diketogulonate reductase-like aldo/keto reductase|nr:aldo/keto reductase [Eubacteriaceae bacterium]